MGMRTLWNGIQAYDSANLNALADVLGISKEDRNWIRAQAAGLPIIGDSLRAQDRNSQMEDYLRNRGVSWSDVKYPALLGLGEGLSGLTSAVNYVSNNIGSLYNDDNVEMLWEYKAYRKNGCVYYTRGHRGRW